MEWPKGMVPDFSPNTFSPGHWQTGLRTIQGNNHWGTLPPSHPQPTPPPSAIPRYQQLNPTIRGQYLNLREGMEAVHHWVSREGAIPGFPTSQTEKQWLEAIGEDSTFLEEFAEPELAQINSNFRASLAGDWHSAQDRWWKFGPQQWSQSIKFLPNLEPWLSQGWNRKGWSLTGLASPLKLTRKYPKPGDLTSIPPEKI